MPQRILNEDWSDYDNRKIWGRPDAKDFLCTEIMEVNYLLGKIGRIYPSYEEAEIRNAIRTCCMALGAPHPRAAFVTCVMKKLRGWIEQFY